MAFILSNDFALLFNFSGKSGKESFGKTLLFKLFFGKMAVFTHRNDCKYIVVNWINVSVAVKHGLTSSSVNTVQLALAEHARNASCWNVLLETLKYNKISRKVDNGGVVVQCGFVLQFVYLNAAAAIRPVSQAPLVESCPLGMRGTV